ncbi:MAG: FeoA family protein [Pseudomonadota bacterium]
MPLTIVQVGRRVRLVAVDTGRGLQSRLAAMGLVPGVEIEVLRNSLHGPFLIAVKGSRIMLGRGMAQKIVVE